MTQLEAREALRITANKKTKRGVFLRFLFEGGIIEWFALHDALEEFPDMTDDYLDDHPDLQDYHLEHTDE